MKTKLLKSKAVLLSLMILSFSFYGLTARAQDFYIGEIRMVGFNYCPERWLEADGRIMPIQGNQALYSLYGTIYGGNGVSTFALPDLRGRIPIGNGAAPGLTPYRQGDRGGYEQVSLTVTQMPAHSHAVMGSKGAGENKSALVLGSGEKAEEIYQPVQQNGSSQPHENRPPYLVMRYCVAVYGGMFPPRE